MPFHSESFMLQTREINHVTAGLSSSSLLEATPNGILSVFINF